MHRPLPTRRTFLATAAVHAVAAGVLPHASGGPVSEKIRIGQIGTKQLGRGIFLIRDCRTLKIDDCFSDLFLKRQTDARLLSQTAVH
jgi:hypothetical protein